MVQQIQMKILWVFLALALATCAPAARPTASSANDYWIENVTLVSAERTGPVEHQSVHIRDGKIAAISAEIPASVGDDARVDGSGKFLIPGLIDSHVHLGGTPGMLRPHEVKNSALSKTMKAHMPRAFLYHGFTTLIDLNGDPAQIRKWNKAALRPQAYSCGPALMIANGYPSHFVPPQFRYLAMPNFIYDPRQTDQMPDSINPEDHSPQAAIMRAKESGAVCIKAFVESGFGPDRGKLPMFTAAMLAQIAEAAKQQGLPLIVHGNAYAAQKQALDAGADMLAHGLWHWRDLPPSTDGQLPVDAQKLLDQLIVRNTGLQSTIQTLFGEHAMFDDDYLNDPALAAVLPAEMINWYRSEEGGWYRNQMRGGEVAPAQNPLEPVLQRLRASVSYLAQNQANFLFGSDTPSGPTYANPPGYNGFRELQMLEDFGLSAAQVFRAATLDNARAFGLDANIGTIEIGKTANLLLLGSNPLDSTQAYDQIDLIILNGRRLARTELLPDRIP